MTMFKLFQILLLIDGVFMWTLIGQGVLGLLVGPRREANFIYRFMSLITRPVWKLTRMITPKLVGDAYIGLVAIFLLLALRLVLYMVFAYFGWIPSMVPAK